MNRLNAKLKRGYDASRLFAPSRGEIQLRVQDKFKLVSFPSDIA